MDDKDTLPNNSSEEASLPRWAAEPSKTSKKWRPLLAMAALSALALYTLNPTPLAEPAHGIQCPYQPEPLHPKIAWEMDDKEKTRSADLLSQAVVCPPCRVRLMGQRIPTESFDDNGEPNEDPRWAPFKVFQSWMKDTFSLAFVLFFQTEG